MQRAFLSCLAGILIGLTVILLPSIVIEPYLTGSSTLRQDASQTMEKAVDDVAPFVVESTPNTASTGEASDSGVKYLLYSPSGPLFLLSISILVSLSFFAVIRRLMYRTASR